MKHSGMSGDLNRERQKAIEGLEARAKAAYDKGEDEGAAEAYDSAARLLERHAVAAPSRKIEQARKGKALRYREYAKALRSGDIPKPEGRGGGELTQNRAGNRDVADRARSKDEDEIHGAVTALLHHSSVTWDKIGGLAETKREIKYALGISLAQLPPGIELAGWRNMLFYGPPGTGKTLLAAATSRAVSNAGGEQGSSSFFNVKVSSIMSKYFGESTKIVSELYGTARDVSPAVVFLDEFEALCGSRGEGDTGTERRILSTILSELDGLAEKERKDLYVLTIAATNRPWDLDPAVLSRFDKKILIPLPDPITRRAILEIHTTKRGFELEGELEDVVDLTEGLSGREIESLCKEVTNTMVADENKEIPNLVDQGLESVKSYSVRVRPLRLADFEAARRWVNPVTTPADMERYLEWRDAAEE
ncbi:MAG: ATP-binding protein [Planctomycetes bacterium]|nr:ATP-binding protein [Planctomycetota bacterium]